MPTHCCVPGCTKKGYTDDSGKRISYFTFPGKDKKLLRKQWIHAIRRDEGKNFKITSFTKVCSRHFNFADIRKSLTGQLNLTTGAVPSVFAWSRSPKKRKSPVKRHYHKQLLPKKLKLNIEVTRDKDETANNSHEIFDEITEISRQDVNFQSKFKDAVTQTDASYSQTQDFQLFDALKSENSRLKCKIEELETARYLMQKTENLQDQIPNSQADKKFSNNEPTEVQKLADKMRSLQMELNSLKRRNTNLSKQLFSLTRFKDDNETINFYTGFKSYAVFQRVFSFLNAGENGENINYWLSQQRKVRADTCEYGNTAETKKGRARTLKPEEEFFLVMCRLRQGFPEKHLGNLFQVSQSTVSRIFISWINFMFLRFGNINIWQTRADVNNAMPEDFKKEYSSSRVIIDCTEIKCEMPSSLHLNGELFSSYKNHTTLKGLIGISPGGALTFISQLYTGSISDREIVCRSGFLDLSFDDKDSVMADKGFTIQDLLPLGVTLNIPPFLGNSAQMSPEDVVLTQKIASLRIHVERAINKIKNFHIFDSVVPLSLFSVVNQMWTVCAFLCNIQPNIISRPS